MNYTKTHIDYGTHKKNIKYISNSDSCTHTHTKWHNKYIFMMYVSIVHLWCTSFLFLVRFESFEKSRSICCLYFILSVKYEWSHNIVNVQMFSLSLSPPLTTVCVCVFVRVRPCITSIHNSASEDTVDMCVVFMECVNMC